MRRPPFAFVVTAAARWRDLDTPYLYSFAAMRRRNVESARHRRAGPGDAAAREHAADATSTRIDPAGQSFTWLCHDDVDEQRVLCPRPFLTFNVVRMASCSSDEVVAGLFLDFEAVRTASSDHGAPHRIKTRRTPRS